jgi:hypothetical protein
MRSALIVVAVVAGWSLSHAAASAATPEQFFQSCEAVLKGTPVDRGEAEIPAEGLPCWHYMAAVQNMSTLVDQRGDHLLGICAPAETTLMQYVQIFVRYVRKNPKELRDNAAAIAVVAMSDAFPCR